MTEGYIKLSRKLLDWEWITEPNTVALWVYILLRANWQDTKWKGIVIPKGSFVTSIASLARQTGLSVRQTRTSLNRLISTNCVTRQAASKYSLITVVKWADYQCYIQPSDKVNDTQIDNRATNERQQIKNNKNIKNKRKNAFGDFSQREYDFAEMERSLFNGIPKVSSKESSC